MVVLIFNCLRLADRVMVRVCLNQLPHYVRNDGQDIRMRRVLVLCGLLWGGRKATPVPMGVCLNLPRNSARREFVGF